MTEWNASDYNQQSTLQETLATQQLARLVLEGRERVLDVGCGDGKISARIADRVPGGSVLGVDPSRDMIAFARSHFSTPEHPNLRFETGDVRHLGFHGGFDLVVSFNALHWVREQDAALHSIHAALEPGGRAILRFVPDGPRKSLEEVIEDTRKSSRWAARFVEFERPYHHFTPEAYRLLARHVGFEVEDVRVDPGTWDFHTREGFVAFCHATFVEWIRLLTEEEQLAFITEVLDRYRQLPDADAIGLNTFQFYQMQVMLRRPSRRS